MKINLYLDTVIGQTIEEAAKEQRAGTIRTVTAREVGARALGERKVAASVARFSGTMFSWEIIIKRYVEQSARASLKSATDLNGFRRWQAVDPKGGQGYRLTSLLTVGEIESLAKRYRNQGNAYTHLGARYQGIADLCRAAGMGDTASVTKVYDALPKKALAAAR